MRRFGGYRIILVCLLLCAISGLAQAATLSLHDPAQIHDAKTVEQALHRLSVKVMRCVAHGGQTAACVCRNACACRFKRDYRAARAAFHRAIARHPGWAGNVVFYKTPENRQGESISFSKAMQRRFRRGCHKPRR